MSVRLDSPHGRYALGYGHMVDLQRQLDSIMNVVSYLDSCSLGKTADFQNSLELIAKYCINAKNICNKAFKL